MLAHDRALSHQIKQYIYKRISIKINIYRNKVPYLTTRAQNSLLMENPMHNHDILILIQHIVDKQN